MMLATLYWVPTGMNRVLHVPTAAVGITRHSSQAAVVWFQVQVSHRDPATLIPLLFLT